MLNLQFNFDNTLGTTATLCK